MPQYAVIFDYNGIIADDEQVHQRAFQVVLSDLGFSLDSQLYAAYFLGRTDRDGLLSLNSSRSGIFQINEIDNLVRQKQNKYQSLINNEDILYPMVIDVIRNLSRRFTLGIVTSSSRTELLTVLERYQILKYFQAIITADDVTLGKPNPEGYIKILNALETPPNHSVVIEDSPSGILAAKSAGIKCIAVLHTAPRTSLVNADIILDTVG
ncbi:MAG: HAD family phosphatase [Deltaproteobacteria bacterium]|nr:HAD family phosphatase [Deltaproteobacteria bacterium]